MGVNKEQKPLPVSKLALSAKNKSRNGCKSISTTNFEDLYVMKQILYYMGRQTVARWPQLVTKSC